MIYYVFSFFIVVCVAAAVYSVSRVHSLELAYLREQTSVSLQIKDIQDRVAKLEVLEETHDDDMEERIADRIEKKWDDGLQSILNFDPFTGRLEE